MGDSHSEAATELVSRRQAHRLGRYTIVEELAKGGMAQLYIARKDGAREICVLKRLLGELETDETASKRFQREAIVASRLDHPNIVRMLEASVEGGVFCIATEFIPGISLEAILTKLNERRRKLPPELSVGIARRMLDALGYAHDLRDDEGRLLEIVHRDLSPRNLLITFAGDVKIIDFGVAHGRVDEFKTAPGIVVGSLEYMSPEQALTHPIDRRSDLYTAALVLYEMLSGNQVVKDEKLMDLLASIVRDSPPPLARIAPEVPRTISDAVEKGLQKSPELRWQKAADFRAALGALPLITNQALAAFLKDNFAEEEAAVIALFERARRSFEEELEAIARPPSGGSGKLARYEPTALVNRKRARAGQRDRVKLAPEDQPANAYVVPIGNDKPTGGGSEITKLGAVVLDMPGEPAPLAKNSVVRVQIELLRRSNLFLRISVLVLGVIAACLGLAAYLSTRSAPMTTPPKRGLQAASTEASHDVPAAVARGKGGEEAEEEEEDDVPEPPPPSETRAVVEAPVRKRADEHPRHEDSRARPQRPKTGEVAPEKGDKPESAPESAAVKTAPANRHSDEIARLQRMLAELRSAPPDPKRFDQVVSAIGEAAKATPEKTQKIVRSELTAAQMEFDVDRLMRAVETIARSKNLSK
jgi:serine/threonine protein kinase